MTVAKNGGGGGKDRQTNWNRYRKEEPRHIQRDRDADKGGKADRTEMDRSCVKQRKEEERHTHTKNDPETEVEERDAHQNFLIQNFGKLHVKYNKKCRIFEQASLDL